MVDAFEDCWVEQDIIRILQDYSRTSIVIVRSGLNLYIIELAGLAPFPSPSIPAEQHASLAIMHPRANICQRLFDTIFLLRFYLQPRQSSSQIATR